VPSDDDQLLEAVADAVLDGAPIDWASVESHAGPHTLPLLNRLRVLAALAEVHRDGSDASASSARDGNGPRPAMTDTVAQPQSWGPLQVLEPIGRGAFGQVYRARDTRLARDVALKLIPATTPSGENVATSIVEEGRLLAQVHHPNVVTIYGAERIGDQVGLWMELLRGRTLEQTLEESARFTMTEAIQIGIQLCGAVSAVHDAGLLHRDIKPHNVMLTNSGRVVLMDFGTGRELADTGGTRLAGTPLYLAPELLSGQNPTIASDIYSIGVLLFHLLTGAYPVQAHSLRELHQAHERQERPGLRSLRPDVTQRLARIIERAIDPTPDRRYRQVDALRDDLAALIPQSQAIRRFKPLAMAAAVALTVTAAWEAGGRGRSTFPNVNSIGHPIVAVMPFENLGAGPDTTYVVDALTDGIIRDLAVIQGLQVRSRESSSTFKDQPRNLREVGAALGANLVVEGSVLRSGTNVRIDARLVPIAGEALWTERFELQLDELFTVQNEISRAIVNALRLPAGRVQRRYDFDIDTYMLYLKARELVFKRGPADAMAAQDLFQQVIATDPAFAPAYAGLAEAYGLTSHYTLRPGVVEGVHPLMQQAARKALELDDLLAEGHAAMGFIHARQYEWDAAQQSFRRAIDLNPSLTHTYINYWTTTLLPLERLDEAERLLNVAMRTDPLSPTVHHELGFLKLTAGRFDEAIDHYQRARTLDPGRQLNSHQHYGRALTFAGRFSEALSFWDAMVDPGGRGGYWKDLPGGQPWTAAALVMAGRRAEVEAMAVKTDEPYRLALFHAALGDKDRTFIELNRAADEVPHRVLPLLVYPEMRLLRGDPRLAALREKLRLPPAS
jgi:TolB-like protein/Flp pilus assembly protein TadD